RSSDLQLLQPGVVGEPAVPDHRIGAEDDLEPLPAGLPWRGRRRLAREAALHGELLRRGGGPGDDAVMQRPLPELLEIRALALALPVAADDLVAGAHRLLQEGREDLVGRATAVERRD